MSARMSALVFQGNIIPRQLHPGAATGHRAMPTGWANTVAAIAYRYQFGKGGSMFFSKAQLEAHGHTRNDNDMDELRKVFLSFFLGRLRTNQYTENQARMFCYFFRDVVEVMFLETLWADVVKVLKMEGILKQPWERLEAEVVALLQQEKGAVRRRLLNPHNTFHFSQNTLCYASFSKRQLPGFPLNMGPHGYAGSIYFTDGRIRLLHRHGPEVAQHVGAVRTVGNRSYCRENIIIEAGDSPAVLYGKTARIQKPCIYEYKPETLNTQVRVEVHGNTITRCVGIRRLEVPEFGWQRLSLVMQCHFHQSRGIPRKVKLNNQQIEVLFFIGKEIKWLLDHPPAGANEIAETGNKLVLEYLDMNQTLQQNLGYG